MNSLSPDQIEQLFRQLLAETRQIHQETPELCDFSPWPGDLVFKAPSPRAVPVLPQIMAMAGDGPFQAALAAVADHADWVQTYSETEVGRHFLDNYGYLELFGPTGIFTSSQCRAFIGYWGQGLYYPTHDHEAEELYLVVGGRCRFESDGEATADLGPGRIRIHRSFQPHAMDMRDGPLLALCLWRGPGMAGRAQISTGPLTE